MQMAQERAQKFEKLKNLAEKRKVYLKEKAQTSNDSSSFSKEVVSIMQRQSKHKK